MTALATYMDPVTDAQRSEAKAITDHIWAITTNDNDRRSAVQFRDAIFRNDSFRFGDAQGFIEKLQKLARSIERRNAPGRDVTGLVPTPCTRCKGTGHLPEFHYVDNGTCRGCEGLGTVLVTPATAARRARNAK